MSSVGPALDSLVAALVPQARNNGHLREELVLHCEEILNRYVYIQITIKNQNLSSRFSQSHIGQSPQTDIGHLTDLVKRHRP